MRMRGRRHRTLAALSVLLLAAAASALPLQPATADAPALDVARIDSYLSEQVHRHRIPGLAVGVVEGSEVIHLRGYGQADEDGRAVTPQTPFVLASTSKPVTALAVMQLVEQGKVRLDAPVHRYLPTFGFRDAAASARITVRQLFHHTSGMPSTACDTRSGATTLEQYVAELRAVDLATPPGTRYNYCSGNYNVLGRILEVVSGDTFGAYVQQHVYAPLAMHHSHTSEQPAVSDGLAQGYQWFFGARVPTHHEYNASQLPSGYLISSAEDLSHFLIAELNGGRYGARQVLSPDGMAALQAPGVDTGGGTTYGLGWMTGSLAGVPAVHHSGVNYEYHSLLVLEPRSGRGLVLLMNSFGIVASASGYRELEDGLVRLVAGEDPPASPGPSVGAVYVVVDLILAALLALALWPLLRLRHWRRSADQRWHQHGRRRRWRLALRPLGEVVLALTLLGGARLVLNRMGAQSWGEGLALFPDLGIWLWALALALLLSGALRLWLLARLQQTAPGSVGSNRARDGDRPAPTASSS